jgi:hypothetical protein
MTGVLGLTARVTASTTRSSTFTACAETKRCVLCAICWLKTDSQNVAASMAGGRGWETVGLGAGAPAPGPPRPPAATPALGIQKGGDGLETGLLNALVGTAEYRFTRRVDLNSTSYALPARMKAERTSASASGRSRPTVSKGPRAYAAAPEQRASSANTPMRRSRPQAAPKARSLPPSRGCPGPCRSGTA